MVQLWRAFGELAPLFLIMVIVISLISYIIYRKKSCNIKKVFTNILLAFSLLAILLVTIYPKYYGPGMPRIVNFVPFNSLGITTLIRNLGLNILLFIPFGFFLSMTKVSKKRLVFKVTLNGLLLSLFIEVIQFIFPMGRSADVDDLISNTFGAFLGFIIWRVLYKKSPDLFSIQP